MGRGTVRPGVYTEHAVRGYFSALLPLTVFSAACNRRRGFKQNPISGSTIMNIKRGTVDFRAIEIDLQEAVSRFLNVPGKSGRQSVNF